MLSSQFTRPSSSLGFRLDQTVMMWLGYLFLFLSKSQRIWQSCRIPDIELLKQDWRSRGWIQICQYISMKWSLCFLVGFFAGLVGFFNNLSIENIAGIKFVITSNMMLANKWVSFFLFFLFGLLLLSMNLVWFDLIQKFVGLIFYFFLVMQVC